MAPLLNSQGEVIGVNTAIRADAQGLGFAIPIETAARIADELFTKGEVQHPFLGIEMVDLTPSKTKQLSQETSFELKQETGILVRRVTDDSPAKEAGLRPGDIIEKINKQPVKSSAQVQKFVESSTVGDILQIQVKREGKLQTFKVQSGAYPHK